MTDTRLIERWSPIAEIGVESTCERRSMTALLPIYYLHVWRARRPLVASQAVVLVSLTEGNASRRCRVEGKGARPRSRTTGSAGWLTPG